VLERGELGDVLVQPVVLACFGGQRPQPLVSGVQIAGGPQGERGLAERRAGVLSAARIEI
jgi:hypothetical protein